MYKHASNMMGTKAEYWGENKRFHYRNFQQLTLVIVIMRKRGRIEDKQLLDRLTSMGVDVPQYYTELLKHSERKDERGVQGHVTVTKVHEYVCKRIALSLI